MNTSILKRPTTFFLANLPLSAVILALAVVSLIFVIKPLIGCVVFLAGILVPVLAVSLHTGVYAILFSMHFDNLTRLSLDSTFALTKLLTALVLILLLLKALLSKDRAYLRLLNHNPLTMTAYLFLLISLVSIVSAHETLPYLGQNLRRVNLVLFYLILITLIRDTRILRKALLFFLVGAVIAGGMGLYEMATGVNVLELRWGPDAIEKASFGTLTKRVSYKESDSASAFDRIGSARALGLSGNPDFHAHSMVMPSLLLLVFMSMTRSRMARLLGALLFVLFLLNILGSGARGGLLALCLGLGVFLLLHRIRHKFVIISVTVSAVFLLLLIFFTVAPQAAFDRFSFGAETETIRYRIGLSQMALAMIEDHPLLGVGTGNFISEYNRYIVPSVPRSPLWTHNCYLQMWAENGVLGFISYLGLYVFAAWNAIRVWRNSKVPFLRVTSVAVLAVIVAYFFYAGIDPVIENELHWMAFALSTAVFNLYRGETGRETAQ